MIFPKTVKYYERATTKNSKGQVVNSFPGVSSRFQASVKPLSLTSAQAAGWSAMDLAANSKFMAYPRGTTIRELDRIVDASGLYYEIRGVNPWTVFPQALLVPIQGETAPIAVEGISLTPETDTLPDGDTLTPIVTFDPVNATNQSLTWESSDEDIATVDDDGVITAMGDGEAVITATSIDGGFTAICTVTAVHS